MPLRDATALAALAARARAELAQQTYLTRDWVRPRHAADGTPVHAVVIVGAGQSGLVIAHGLRRDGVHDVVLLDQRPEGRHGVWEDFARMDELRTPKTVCGAEFGLPSLSVRAWYVAAHGAAAWEAVERLPRLDWAAYLNWYRDTLGLAVTSEAKVTDIAPHGDGVLAVTAGARRWLARTVVLATGFEGAGEWGVPEVVAAALPRDRYDHSNGPIDFAHFAGRRIGVLGHGASAFDAAVAALRAGAARVDLCFRRERLPTANPHRYVETGGFMGHFCTLPDALRWRFMRAFRRMDQPPAEGGFRAALALPGFHWHAGCAWLSVAEDGADIVVRTPRGGFRFDHLICATGIRPDLTRCPELAGIAPRALLWGEAYAPPPEEADAAMARYPYLGAHYQFTPRDPADDWLRRVFSFNAASVVSHGSHSTSISGHRMGVPRLIRGVTRRLFEDQADALLDGLLAYDAPDLVLPEAGAAAAGIGAGPSRAVAADRAANRAGGRAPGRAG